VVAFRIKEDGRLQRIAQQSTETGNNTGLPDIDPSGRYAYISTMVYGPQRKGQAVGSYNDLLQFRIAEDDTLQPLSTPKIRMRYFWEMVFVKSSQKKTN
jgi:hypothetical protein